MNENDIAGLKSVRKLIREKIIYPIRRPDLHHGLHQPPRGILLFGPPGSGERSPNLIKTACFCVGQEKR